MDSIDTHLIADFYDHFNDRLQRDFVYGNKRVEAAIERVASQITESTKTLLDVGCGCGQLAWQYAHDHPDIEGCWNGHLSKEHRNCSLFISAPKSFVFRQQFSQSH